VDALPSLPRWLDADAYTDVQVLGSVLMLDGWLDQIAFGEPIPAINAHRAALTAAVATTVGMSPATPLDTLARTTVQRHDPDLARRVLAVALPMLGRALADVRDTLPFGGAQGHVTSVNTSGGGVPKQSIHRADIAIDGGLAGDRQAAPRHHGRPWQAVCLWSQEVIDGLAAEGHPIAAGNAGENLTVAGLDWATLRPGHLLAVGDGRKGALLEVTAYAIPCSKNARWFSDGDSARMSHEVRPGRSRLYAAVLRGGPVAEGDAVEVVG
jgi:MOSC domain-containing protein YiiM